jgi:hypothetical protein
MHVHIFSYVYFFVHEENLLKQDEEILKYINIPTTSLRIRNVDYQDELHLYTLKPLCCEHHRDHLKAFTLEI